MKRLAALMLCLALLLSAAHAEGAIAGYLTPGGAQMVYLDQNTSLDVPDGLQPLYDLMLSASRYSDVYLMRMQNGRAVASLSCTVVQNPLSAQQLYDRWPAIRSALLQEADITGETVSIEERYGFETLHLSVRLSRDGLPMLAEARAFCRGNQMMELWAVSVDDDLPETLSDRRDASAFLNSLDFSEKATQMFEGVPFRDADGRFRLEVPADAVVITKQSTMDEISAVREAFVAANKEGADRLFDEIYRDVLEQNVAAVFTADGKGVVELFASREEAFAGASLDDLQAIGPSLTGSLKTRYGAALNLSTDGRVRLGGYEQVLLCYWVRSGECDVMLDITACVALEDWLCEVDIFTIDGDLETRQLLHAMLGQTLAYTLD